MKIAISFLFFSLSATALCQSSFSSFDLPNGEFSAGYAHYRKYDRSRSYKSVYQWRKEFIPRPIDISIWYPTASSKRAKRMRVSDYLQVIKYEEEWPMLPDDKILGWFAYPDIPENRKRLSIECQAVRDAEKMSGSFPVIIYAPGYQSTSVENFAMCEFLATRGFIVLASPSKGSNKRFMGGATTIDLEAQSRDIQFLISEAFDLPQADTKNIAVIGHSFGGMANILAKMQTDFIKVVICLDGSVKYQLSKLEASPSFDLEKMDAAFLFVAQKDIPQRVMIEDGIDTTLNTSFRFFDSLRRCDAFYLKSKVLTHDQFTSMGILFNAPDPRQDMTESAIVSAYRELARCIPDFLRVYQKREAARFEPHHYQSMSAVAHKQTDSVPPYTFEDFIMSLRGVGFPSIEVLCKKLMAEHPGFFPVEWKLNALGLQLVFTGDHADGIHVLTFATRMYPGSSNAFDSLGEAYLFIGDKKNAALNFARALELDPLNSNSARQLDALTTRK